jgi:hypothetical protein
MGTQEVSPTGAAALAHRPMEGRPPLAVQLGARDVYLAKRTTGQ